MGVERANIAVLQSGGCTPVINESLWAVVNGSQTSFPSSQIFGSLRGIEGLISDSLTDLCSVTDSSWAAIRQTPGAALGATRKKLNDTDIQPLLDTLDRHGIGYLFLIGGNDTADTTAKISEAGKASGMSLGVIHVPKTIDNDLVQTDHSPGYGSAARFVALATMGSGQDALSMGKASPITVIEVMGRDAGWLAMASGLGKRSDQDAPHFIGIPEVPIDEELFVQIMSDAYTKFGFAVAVISENCRGTEGILGPETKPLLVDDFGHAYHESPGKHLTNMLSNALNTRVRHEYPGTIQRSFVENISSSDKEEAKLVGLAAIEAAASGFTDRMVTLVRSSNSPYACKTGLTSVETVANRVATVPLSFRTPGTNLPTESFYEYAGPLIGNPLPAFLRF